MGTTTLELLLSLTGLYRFAYDEQFCRAEAEAASKMSSIKEPLTLASFVVAYLVSPTCADGL